MSSSSPSPSGRPWFGTAIALTLLIAIVSFITGLIWLPLAQPDSRLRSVWDAICTSAGLIRNVTATEIVTDPSRRTSSVVLSPDMLQAADTESIGRGATLALQCTMCHGARGMSHADTPNLAGQYAPTIYKQLRDYKSGARTSAIMSPRVGSLSDQDMRDLAAYYAYLPRPRLHPENATPPPQIVRNGAPMRNIPPCATCHGEIDYKLGSAWLEGESAIYLRTQLEEFASGDRHNDINGQMRNIARGMTRSEIDGATDYYASQR